MAMRGADGRFISVKVNDHTNEFNETLRREQIRRMELATRYLRDQVVRVLGDKSPPASAPGEPPHLVTGNLRRSIGSEVDESMGQVVAGYVGTNAKYGGYLEKGTPVMAKRPFLTMVLQREQPTLSRILTG